MIEWHLVEVQKDSISVTTSVVREGIQKMPSLIIEYAEKILIYAK